ncbi:uncharacterized protein LOC143212014 [Lasioglossum baleicum]|uniref:uncharacterized protein LOC143212014 n=1 Tax=Lasioglossum baleicum TaxID=434251 RepID=UPI003FCD75CA
MRRCLKSFSDCAMLLVTSHPRRSYHQQASDELFIATSRQTVHKEIVACIEHYEDCYSTRAKKKKKSSNDGSTKTVTSPLPLPTATATAYTDMTSATKRFIYSIMFNYVS